MTFAPATREVFPNWTSDGGRVAYGQRDGNGPASWTWSDGAGAVEHLFEDGSSGVPQAFSRDGTALVFGLRGDLYMLPLEGDRTPRPLWESPFRERAADLSPDGHWLAYESNQSGQYEVWVRPFPNVGDGEWPISSGFGRWPLWDPSGGDELFFVGPQGMMTVSVETEPTFSTDTPKLLFDTEGYGTPENTGDNRRIDIHPDGERFLMFKESSVLQDAPDPILIQNWIDELQRLVPTRSAWSRSARSCLASANSSSS